jgi:septum formation protein
MKNVKSQKLILGSGSPRRKEILSLAGYEFEVLVSDVEESYPEHLSLRNVPEFLAIKKARAIQEQFNIENRPILTADTIVLINNEILGKPVDREDAIQILQKLSGATHEVLSGVCYLNGKLIQSITDITKVTFKDIDLKDIEFYVDQFQPYDKAGAYAIQEWIGVRYISKIEGCYYNVMGLPMTKILQELF